VLGLIAALWLSLAPPVEPVPGPTFDEVVELEPPPETEGFEPAELDLVEPSEPMAPAEPVAPREPVPNDDTDLLAPSFSRSTEPRGSTLVSPSRASVRPRPGQSPPWPGKWRRWGAPLLSTFVPGLGQIANGQVLQGAGVFFGSAGGLVGALVLYRARNDGSRPLGREYARLTGYGLLSTGVPLLWIFAIVDAYEVANEVEEVRPELEHRLRLSVARTMTVGFRADPDRPGFYDEWTGAMLGQVARRWSVGASDLGLKFDRARLDVVQFGARVDYRVFDRRRLWIDLALGSAVQVKTRRSHAALDPEAPAIVTKTKLGAVPYVQIDLRWFLIDRLSLDLIPRLSVPVTTRYFSADRALPRFAPTLELGASASAYF